VACSGGADSVFLLLMLYARLPRAREQLRVLHFNHRTRGRAAAADQEFVEELASSLGVACLVGEPTGGLPRDEAALRKSRYRWMVQVYHQLRAGGLFLGHHADDVFETQLMALFGGSGPAGMASPLPRKVFPDGHIRLRPLIRLRRAQIEGWLTRVGVPWREDASNADTTVTRNWIRHQLVPFLTRGLGRNLTAGSGRTRLLMEEATEVMDFMLQRQGCDTGDSDRLDLSPLSGLPRGVVRRVIMAWWLRHRPDQRLPYAPLDEVLDQFASGRSARRISLGNDRFLELDSGRLRLRFRKGRPDPAPFSIAWNPLCGPLFLPDGSRLRAEAVTDTGGGLPFRSAEPAIEAWIRFPETPLLVRRWLPGDRYRPLGAPGRRKVQDMFTDAKIGRERRKRLPVLLDSMGELIWIPGFAPAEAAALGPGTKSALKLTYHPL
jgi:tRNA(Ile)-lysidine synthase